jgi:hypothetical protein
MSGLASAVTFELSHNSGISNAVRSPGSRRVRFELACPRYRQDFRLIVDEVAMTVGDALGRFYGPGWYMQQVKPLIDRLGVSRATVPLTGIG